MPTGRVRAIIGLIGFQQTSKIAKNAAKKNEVSRSVVVGRHGSDIHVPVTVTHVPVAGS